MKSKIVGFVIAVFVAYFVAVLFVSFGNLSALSGMSVPLTVSDRLYVVRSDLVGMISSLLVLIAIALFIAWLFTGLVLARFMSPNAMIYALAGFVAMISIHLIMYAVFGMSAFASTREYSGLFAQGLAGAVAGLLYYHLANKLEPTNNS